MTEQTPTGSPYRPEAGWYLDPSDPTSYRYFDGIGWTEHRRPHPDLELLHQRDDPAGDS